MLTKYFVIIFNFSQLFSHHLLLNSHLYHWKTIKQCMDDLSWTRTQILKWEHHIYDQQQWSITSRIRKETSFKESISQKNSSPRNDSKNFHSLFMKLNYWLAYQFHCVFNKKHHVLHFVVKNNGENIGFKARYYAYFEECTVIAKRLISIRLSKQSFLWV